MVARVATQYHEDLPVVRPLVRRFDIEVGHCSRCRRRVQGRHRLQTSDALGAASVQLGPAAVALVVRMHTQAIRPAVVIRKVCGGNRTRHGADTQQVLASVVRTAHQRHLDLTPLIVAMLRSPRPTVLDALRRPPP